MYSNTTKLNPIQIYLIKKSRQMPGLTQKPTESICQKLNQDLNSS